MGEREPGWYWAKQRGHSEFSHTLYYSTSHRWYAGTIAGTEYHNVDDDWEIGPRILPPNAAPAPAENLCDGGVSLDKMGWGRWRKCKWVVSMTDIPIAEQIATVQRHIEIGDEISATISTLSDASALLVQGHTKEQQAKLVAIWCAVLATLQSHERLKAEHERAMKAIGLAKELRRPSALKLACGEMTAQEVRTVQAVLSAIERAYDAAL